MIVNAFFCILSSYDAREGDEWKKENPQKKLKI